MVFIIYSSPIMNYGITFHEFLEFENAFQSWWVKFEMVKYAKFGFNRLIFHKNSLEMDYDWLKWGLKWLILLKIGIYPWFKGWYQIQNSNERRNIRIGDERSIEDLIKTGFVILEELQAPVTSRSRISIYVSKI